MAVLSVRVGASLVVPVATLIGVAGAGTGKPATSNTLRALHEPARPVVSSCGAACVAHRLHADAVHCAPSMICTVVWIRSSRCAIAVVRGRRISFSSVGCPPHLFRRGARELAV
jgi:hypothetical protein